MTEVHVRVTVENIGPEGGIGISPTWVGFHNGSFDTHDLGRPVDEWFERLGEDANLEPITSVFANSGAGDTQGRIIGDSPPLRGFAPGESGSTTFTLDSDDPLDQYFSYAWMVIPSNDAFAANDDPRAYALFDANGGFVETRFTVLGTEVRDLGTEVNDEGLRTTAALGQLVSDTGTPQGGVVADHPGLLPPGVPGPGGVLDDPRYDQDFDVPGYTLARVTVAIDGDDRLVGSDRQDRLDGGFGDDLLYGREGRDVVLGGDGDDMGRGGADGDLLNGGNGADSLYGNLGSDSVYGGAGDDVLFGGQGDDLIQGDAGDDMLTGGSGGDVFVADIGQGDDVVLDFNAAAGDRLALGLDGRGRPYSWDADADGNLVLLLDGTSLTLVGVPGTTNPAVGDDYLVFG